VADFGLATLRRPPAAVRGASVGRPPAAPAATSGDDVSAAEQPGEEPFLDLTGLTGSFRFMAPEVYAEKPYGRPVDVYSFAMIAYNILESRYVPVPAYDFQAFFLFVFSKQTKS
jgi:serine/threonine protein kinase